MLYLKCRGKIKWNLQINLNLIFGKYQTLPDSPYIFGAGLFLDCRQASQTTTHLTLEYEPII